jgi:uncharacterized protein DUF4145
LKCGEGGVEFDLVSNDAQENRTVAKYVAPRFKGKAFNCPCCGVYAHQRWVGFFVNGVWKNSTPGQVSICAHCDQRAYWLVDGRTMIFPPMSDAPPPHDDMPEDVAQDFSEARMVLAPSPRSAAALLRLALQRLCVHLGQKGENINDDIGELVKAGLSPKIQKAFDIVRIAGNNAVHPGELDLRDDHDTALKLFEMLNMIVEQMITRPSEIDKLYNMLPEGARKSVERRDGGHP